MATENEIIAQRIREIQEMFPNNPEAANYQIALEARDAFGDQALTKLATATGSDVAAIADAARQVGVVLPGAESVLPAGAGTGGAGTGGAGTGGAGTGGAGTGGAGAGGAGTGGAGAVVPVAGTGEAVANEITFVQMADGSFQRIEPGSMIPSGSTPVSADAYLRGTGVIPDVPRVTTDFSGDYEDVLQSYGRGALQMAEELATRPFTPFPGERVAPFTQTEQEARQRLLSLSQAGVGTPQVQRAAEVAEQVAGYTPPLLSDVDIQPYMSQYQQGVTDIALRELDRQRQLRQQDVAAQAQRAGAFGGARQGIVESELERQYAQQAADIATTGQQQAFQYAQQAALSDLAAQRAAPTTQLAGASALSQAANQLRALGYSDAEVAQQLGQQERALGQAGLDVNFQEFMRAQAFPAQQLQQRLAPLGLGTQVAQVAPTIDQPSFLQQTLGTLGAAGQTYNLLSGGTFGSGAQGGGLLGAFT